MSQVFFKKIYQRLGQISFYIQCEVVSYNLRNNDTHYDLFTISRDCSKYCTLHNVVILQIFSVKKTHLQRT